MQSQCSIKSIKLIKRVNQFRRVLPLAHLMCAEVHRGSVNLYGIVHIYKVGSSQSAFAYAGIDVQADGRVVGVGMGGSASGVCRQCLRLD